MRAVSLPVSPVARNRKDSTPRHGRLLHPSSWAERDDRDHAAKNLFQGGSPKTGHPISPPGPPHRKKSFLTKFPGWDLDENLKPNPYRGAHCRGSAARQNEVGLAARAARWPGCLGCGSCSGLLCDGEPRQQPLADLGATSAQLKRRKLRSDITQA